MHNSGASRRENAEVYLAVIASEAKQSISPRDERMDCFVASLLAMLGWTAPDGIDVPNWSLM